MMKEVRSDDAPFGNTAPNCDVARVLLPFYGVMWIFLSPHPAVLFVHNSVEVKIGLIGHEQILPKSRRLELAYSPVAELPPLCLVSALEVLDMLQFVGMQLKLLLQKVIHSAPPNFGASAKLTRGLRKIASFTLLIVSLEILGLDP